MLISDKIQSEYKMEVQLRVGLVRIITDERDHIY